MLFSSMGAPDFFSHKSDRELKLDKGEVAEDSEGDEDFELGLTDTDDEQLNSILSETRTPFSSRSKYKFTPNAESLRDPLRGRHATASSTDVAISDVELEATGALRLHETFDIADLYKELHRAKRSETVLNILSCQFSPSKDFLAIALSTGEIEVLEYDLKKSDLRICYTLMDRDVNGESINCTNICWLPDGKKLLATYTNGYLKMWHVVSKKAVWTRNENEFTRSANDVIDNPDIVSQVFKSNISNKESHSSNRRAVLCVSYSRSVSVNMEEHFSQSTTVPHLKKQRLVTTSMTPEPFTQIDPGSDQFRQQVTLVATGGSDGVILVWMLTDSNKDTSLSLSGGNKAGGSGSHLVFHRRCVHGGGKKAMDGHIMKVFAIRFLPREPKRFLSGGWDGLIFKWDAVSGQCLMSCKSPVICSSESMDLDTAVERPLVLCGDHGAGFLDIIDYRYDDNFVVDTRILMPTERFVMPYVCSFLGNDKILVGGSNPKCLRVIDRRVNIEKQTQTASGVKINKQGEAIILGSLDNLPSAVSCVTLGKEDRQKRRQIIACSGSLVMILSCLK